MRFDFAGRGAILGALGAEGSTEGNSVAIATAILIVIHLVMAVALVFLILLHSGKGGLGDLFGGGMQGGMGGATLAERNLNRLTVFTAVVFAATTITLAILLGS